jgi:hypothetical protein
MSIYWTEKNDCWAAYTQCMGDLQHFCLIFHPNYEFTFNQTNFKYGGIFCRFFTTAPIVQKASTLFYCPYTQRTDAQATRAPIHRVSASPTRWRVAVSCPMLLAPERRSSAWRTRTDDGRHHIISLFTNGADCQEVWIRSFVDALQLYIFMLHVLGWVVKIFCLDLSRMRWNW